MEDLDGRIEQANRDLAASQTRCHRLEHDLAQCKAALGACDRAAELIERAMCQDHYEHGSEKCRFCDVGRGLQMIRSAVDPK